MKAVRDLHVHLNRQEVKEAQVGWQSYLSRLMVSHWTKGNPGIVYFCDITKTFRDYLSHVIVGPKWTSTMLLTVQEETTSSSATTQLGTSSPNKCQLFAKTWNVNPTSILDGETFSANATLTGDNTHPDICARGKIYERAETQKRRLYNERILNVHWCTLSRVVAGQKQGLF